MNSSVSGRTLWILDSRMSKAWSSALPTNARPCAVRGDGARPATSARNRINSSGETKGIERGHTRRDKSCLLSVSPATSSNPGTKPHCSAATEPGATAATSTCRSVRPLRRCPGTQRAHHIRTHNTQLRAEEWHSDASEQCARRGAAPQKEAKLNASRTVQGQAAPSTHRRCRLAAGGVSSPSSPSAAAVAPPWTDLASWSWRRGPRPPSSSPPPRRSGSGALRETAPHHIYDSALVEAAMRRSQCRGDSSFPHRSWRSRSRAFPATSKSFRRASRPGRPAARTTPTLAAAAAGP